MSRRDRAVNWGDRMRIVGRERKSLADVSVSEPSSMTVYATANVRGGPLADGVTVLFTIDWGHGGASVEQRYLLAHRLRVPLVASTVVVSAQLVGADGHPPSSSVFADVSAFIARGADGETLRNTEWIAQSGATGTLQSGPARVMKIEGLNVGGTATWLHVFDGAPVLGGEPVILRRARAGRLFVVRRFDSQAFRTSVQWAASATPLTYTPDLGAQLRVDAEVLL